MHTIHCHLNTQGEITELFQIEKCREEMTFEIQTSLKSGSHVELTLQHLQLDLLAHAFREIVDKELKSSDEATRRKPPEVIHLSVNLIDLDDTEGYTFFLKHLLKQSFTHIQIKAVKVELNEKLSDGEEIIIQSLLQKINDKNIEVFFQSPEKLKSVGRFF